MLEKTADEWGRPTSLGMAMSPVIPWSPEVRIVKHAFEQDFTTDRELPVWFIWSTGGYWNQA